MACDVTPQSLTPDTQTQSPSSACQLVGIAIVGRGLYMPKVSMVQSVITGCSHS
jgi:hypothetical protein